MPSANEAGAPGARAGLRRGDPAVAQGWGRGDRGLAGGHLVLAGAAGGIVTPDCTDVPQQST